MSTAIIAMEDQYEVAKARADLAVTTTQLIGRLYQILKTRP